METISPWNIVQSELQSSDSEPPLLVQPYKKKSFIGRRYRSYFWRTSTASSEGIAQTKLSLASEAEAKRQKKE